MHSIEFLNENMKVIAQPDPNPTCLTQPYFNPNMEIHIWVGFGLSRLGCMSMTYSCIILTTIIKDLARMILPWAQTRLLVKPPQFSQDGRTWSNLFACSFGSVTFINMTLNPQHSLPKNTSCTNLIFIASFSYYYCRKLWVSMECSDLSILTSLLLTHACPDIQFDVVFLFVFLIN